MKFRKKPIVIEACRWYGYNYFEICEFLNFEPERDASELYGEEPAALLIPTLEGTMIASIGDYIIKGVNGEFYPCKPDIFVKTYELVE